jgi:hypothetical protein
VRNDERQRILMFRTNVNEMNVEPVDLDDEVRQGLQFCLTLAPVPGRVSDDAGERQLGEQKVPIDNRLNT